MSNKKKILWIGDDIRMHSGVATMGREMILGCAHKYDFCCIAGAIKNPDTGKVLDLSQATNQLRKINDAYIKLYPVDGYGNEDILHSIINQERPDAICMITDPRFFGWLFSLEHSLRKKLPITYYNIWDDIPYPMYNRAFYESCDALLSISRQTENINKWVLDPKNCCTINEPMNGKTLLHYVPHGINEDMFHKKDSTTQEYRDRRKAVFNGKKYDFVIFYNSRNVQRKRTSDIILGYRTFCDNLPKEEAAKCCLLLHTEIMQEAGTNLIAVKEALCPDYDIIFSPAKMPPEEMAYLYSMADVTVNASCIPPGYKVTTKIGPKNIEEIKIGETVLTHKGRFRPVLKTFEYDNVDCEMVKITPFNLNEPLELTSEHKVWAVKKSKMKNKLLNENESIQQYMEWIPSGELSLGDLVMYPKLTENMTENVVFDLEKFIPEYKSRKYLSNDSEIFLPHSKNVLNRKIPLTNDLAYLLGRWCGDGSNNNICFNSDYGNDEINKIGNIFVNIFGGSYSIKPHGQKNKKCTNLFFSHPFIGIMENFFKTICGNSSNTKKIPSEILFNKDETILNSFINGLIDSDGYDGHTNDSNYTKIVTVSNVLQQQLITALVRLNKKIRLAEGTSGYKPGNTHHQIYFTHTSDDNDSSRSWFKDGYYLMSINKIEKYLYTGKVYNIEVEEDNSYTMKSFILHNSNEGYGLSCAESIMCETPVIVSVTGGLQDQIGQTDDEGNPIKFSQGFGSNSEGKYKNHGVWAYPLWPVTRMIQGSIPTPYIFDDLTKWEDIADAYMYWYKMSKSMREKCGAEGRRWACNEGGINATNMCKQYVDAMEYVFHNWKPSKSFGLYSVKDHVGNFMLDKNMGFEVPTIDQVAIETKLEETKKKLEKL